MSGRYFTRKNSPGLLALALFFFSFLLYKNTVPNDYVLDDSLYYTENSLVQKGMSGIPEILSKGSFYGYSRNNDWIYRPMLLICFAIEHTLYGNNPHMNHFFNTLFYSLCCCVLFFLLCRLFNGHSLTAPFLIALLFTAHPIHTEAVANIKGLDELLAFLFAVSALYATVVYYDKKNILFFIAGLFCYLCCLLSKEHALTFPGIIPLALYTFRPISLKKNALLTLPFCGIALIYLALRTMILDHSMFDQSLDIINNTLLAAHTCNERLATAFLILGKYLRLLIVPYPLSWDYSYNQIPITTWADPKAAASLIACLGILIAGIAGIRRKSPVAFGIFFFLLTFALSTNLILTISVTLGERLLFTPSLGFCIAAVMLLARTGLFRRRALLAALIAATISLHAFITINRNTDWKNNVTLFTRDIAKVPNNARARIFLGHEFLLAGENERDPGKKRALLAQAVAEYRQGLAIYPRYSDTWYELGITYHTAGQTDKALEAYHKALAIDPKSIGTINNIGTIYFEKGDFATAAEYYQKALDINTNVALSCANFGAANHMLGNYSVALYWYEKALALNPKDRMTCFNTGVTYASLNDTAKARQYFTKASLTDPAAKK